MKTILDYLKANGEKLDTEIAEATGISLAKTREYLSELSAKGEVMFCRSIRLVDGEKIEGMIYRISGYIVKNKPGAKSKAQLKLN